MGLRAERQLCETANNSTCGAEGGTIQYSVTTQQSGTENGGHTDLPVSDQCLANDGDYAAISHCAKTLDKSIFSADCGTIESVVATQPSGTETACTQTTQCLANNGDCVAMVVLTLASAFAHRTKLAEQAPQLARLGGDSDGTMSVRGENPMGTARATPRASPRWTKMSFPCTPVSGCMSPWASRSSMIPGPRSGLNTVPSPGSIAVPSPSLIPRMDLDTAYLCYGCSMGRGHRRS